jgi:2-methylcitrate dehydratase PrpD
VAPALLALTETQRVNGKELLHAHVLGVQVACRIGNAISPEHYDRGWHITSTCGTFGAAAGAGKLLGLDAAQLAGALGNAASQACGTVEALGTPAKSLSVGNAARNGLLSALLAKDGFGGPEQPLEGRHGYLNVTGERPRFSAATEDLGGRWENRFVMYKPYPCGVVVNPVIDACLKLRNNAALGSPPDLAQIEHVELVGHSLLRIRTDRPGVKTGRTSQVSAQHAIGVVLKTGKAGMQQFSDAAVADPAIQALGRKVSFVDDDSMSIDAVKMTVTLAGGKKIVESIEHSLGSLKNPMSDRALEDKLRTLCREGGSGCDPEPLIGALWKLDEAPDAGVLLKLAAG